jgi:hypothetical protein
VNSRERLVLNRTTGRNGLFSSISSTIGKRQQSVSQSFAAILVLNCLSWFPLITPAAWFNVALAKCAFLALILLPVEPRAQAVGSHRWLANFPTGASRKDTTDRGGGQLGLCAPGR